MSKIQIKHKHTELVLFETESDSLKLALQSAVNSNANLCNADLCGANLRGADLCNANLRGANLCDADLCGANLCDADLCGANLCDADLCDANLRGADLCDADLCNADLRGANLCNADLCGAKNIPTQYLTIIRDDFWAVLSGAPKEVDGLRKAIEKGNIDGSTYQGDCACLVGTLAKVCGVHYQELEIVKPNGGRPIERYFLQIREGDTPENSTFSKQVLEWLNQWKSNMEAAFGTVTK